MLTHRLIGPLATVDHLDDIRPAFHHAAGVIINGTVPPAVTEEIRDARKVPQKYWDDKWHTQTGRLPLTELWVRARTAEIAALFSNKREMSRIYAGSAFSEPWHTDHIFTRENPLIHLHIEGAGMVTAAPQRPLMVAFNGKQYASTSKHPTVESLLMQHQADTIVLRPGQALLITDGVLHKSGEPGEKLRAVHF